MDFRRMTLVNIYGDIRNYLTGVEGYDEPFTISCVQAHLDMYSNNLKKLTEVASNIEKHGGPEAQGLLSSLLSGLSGVIENNDTTEEDEKPKKKRSRPKKDDNIEVA